MLLYRLFQAVTGIAFLISFSGHSVAQTSGGEKLCQLAMKPVLGGLTLHWESFNMFGNSRSAYSESAFTQSGEGSSCKLRSQRSSGASPERPCTWTLRLSCDLELNKEPISHSFSNGPSYQRGKLQWVGNEKLAVKVKQGETVTTQERDVAVIKFVGTWISGANSGYSTSTVYYDRDFGALLKAEGAHDNNRWGDTVTQIDLKP